MSAPVGNTPPPWLRGIMNIATSSAAVPGHLNGAAVAMLPSVSHPKVTAGDEGDIATRARVAAMAYLNRGWVPIPIPVRTKAPVGIGWQQRTLESASSTLDTDFPSATGKNVGMLNGAPSGDLTDIDVDCPEVLPVLKHFLPKTLTFGRPGNPDSHWEFLCKGAKTTQFKDPISKDMLVEIRSTGTQTVWPGSVHTSGEIIAFQDPSVEPVRIEPDVLHEVVQRCAAVALLVRRWPGEGSRHSAQLALAGGLLQASYSEEEAVKVLRLVCDGASDENVSGVAATVASTVARLAAGEQIKAWGALKEHLPAAVVDQVIKWLGGSKARKGLPTIRIVAGELPRMVQESIRGSRGERAQHLPTQRRARKYST